MNEVYALIISDLEGALANVPASSNKYRASKGAALSLLAQVYATKPSPDFNKVVTYTDQLMTEGYSLLPTYDHLFDSEHRSKRRIYFRNQWKWKQCLVVGNFHVHRNRLEKFNTPSNDLIKSFDAQGDAIRKASTVKFEPVGWSDKYWSSSSYPFAWKQREQSGNQNVYIFRYADLLLLRAEAKVRLGDYTGAAALVNQVRARVNLAPITITGATDGINKVLEEKKTRISIQKDNVGLTLREQEKLLKLLKIEKMLAETL